MAWIESHQELAHHPKTRRLAQELHCGVPAAIGYLHLLWWWALSYAPVGTIEPPGRDDALRACHWSRDPSKFWGAMVAAGFLEDKGSGNLAIHDWDEYAGRYLDQRKKDAERKRKSRTSAGRPVDRGPDVRRTGPNQPDQPPVGPVVNSSGPRAHSPGPGGPLGAALNGNAEEPERLPNGAQQCPLAPHTFLGLYADHLATDARHKVRPEPETFGRKPADTLLPEVGDSPVSGLDINALHEHLLARERDRA